MLLLLCINSVTYREDEYKGKSLEDGLAPSNWWLCDSFLMYKSLIKYMFARLHHPGHAWRCPKGGGGKGGEMPAAWDSYLFALNRATDLPLEFCFHTSSSSSPT